jgi:hypothetical protein
VLTGSQSDIKGVKMYYIEKEKNGLITGRYLTSIHGDNIPSNAVEVSEDIFKASIQMQRPALINGELVELPPEAPTPEQLTQQAKSAVYGLLDQTAQQFDYRNMTEVSQFVLSGTWKEEADALLAWQDSVWVKAYELLKEPITTVDDFVAQLPKFVFKPD